MKGRFLQSLALLRAGHNPCQRRKTTVSTNNGLVLGPVHNLLMQFFTPGSSKIEVFETYFYDNVTTGYDHPRLYHRSHHRSHYTFFFLEVQVHSAQTLSKSGGPAHYTLVTKPMHPGGPEVDAMRRGLDAKGGNQAL